MIDLANILSIALLHSLWQISVIGILLLGALHLIAGERAALRYTLALSALYTVPIMFLGTCIFVSANTNTQTYLTLTQGSAWSLTPLITVIWLLGAAFPTYKLCRDINGVRQLIAHNFEAVPPVIAVKFATLKSKLGIKETVRIGLCDTIGAPCAVAFFRPIVLLPVACISQLSIDEIEAILAHELAHISRFDGINKLFQSIVGLTFYYHPVLAWISKQVSDEREHACDDLAKSVLSDTQPLASGLLKIGLLQCNNTLLLAAKSKGLKALEARLQRIVTLPSRPILDRRTNPFTLTSINTILLTCTAIIISALFAPSQNTANANTFTKSELITIKNKICGEVAADNLYFRAPWGSTGYANIELKDGVIYMNGTRVPNRTQEQLIAIFQSHDLFHYRNVKLRYYGDDVKLTLNPKGDNDGELYVFRMEPDTTGTRS